MTPRRRVLLGAAIAAPALALPPLRAALAQDAPRPPPPVTRSRGQETALQLISRAQSTQRFAALIRETRLEAEFSRPQPRAGFFVPLDVSLERAPALLLESFRADPELRRQFVLNHIGDFAGTITFGGPDMTVARRLRMRSGNTYSLSSEDRRLPTLNGIPLTFTNIRASNGMCHALDGILRP